ncbi:MAG: NADPH:quinone reductase [Pseudonocardiales bacterium]|nr:MAG: NADPH:quinone reductase [Pseudonocardiales bacterium]
MRVVTQQEIGGPEVLHVEEAQTPSPLPSEVLVAVRATGLNPVDAAIRSGGFPVFGRPPFVLGWDVSGVVTEVVPGVNRFQVGDEVYGMPLFPRPAGAYAEFVAAPSRQLALKPRSIDHVHAGALPLAGLTAWQALVDVADVQQGQRVLVHAAGGGVGHLAVQIAKHLGAYVIGTASAGKHEFVRDLGADEVVDYRAVDFTEAVHDVDVVLELVGGDYGTRSIEVLRTGGLLVTAVERDNADLAARTRAAGRRFAGITVEPDGAGLERLAELVDAGRLRVHVEHALPLEDAAKAHALLESGLRGKVVLTI